MKIRSAGLLVFVVLVLLIVVSLTLGAGRSASGDILLASSAVAAGGRPGGGMGVSTGPRPVSRPPKIGRSMVFGSSYDSGPRNRSGYELDPAPINFEDQTVLLISVSPPTAEVILDDHVLGSAQELLGQPVKVVWGSHVIRITGDGFRPYDARFTTWPNGRVTEIRVALLPR